MVVPPLTGAWLVDLGAEEAGDAGSQKRNPNEGEDGSAELRLIAEIAAVPAEDEAAMVMAMGTSQATCSFHSMPMECQAMVEGLDMSRRWGNAGEVCGSRRRSGAIPGIDDVSAGEHGEPGEHGHHSEIDAEESFVLDQGFRPER